MTCEGEVKGKEELVLEVKTDAKIVLKASAFSSAEDSLRSPVLIKSCLEDFEDLDLNNLQNG
jgi:hypothetical protein